MKKTNNKIKIVRPREYVSYSQLSAWDTSKERWWQVYVLGQSGYNEEQVAFGGRFSEAREKDESIENDIGAEFARIMMPSYPKREYKIEAKLDGVRLLGKLDSFDPEGLKVGEDKTGKLWTKKMVDESEQLDFYALLVYAKYRRLPSEMRLNWAETKTDEWGNIIATGKFEIFYTSRDLVRIMRMFGKVRRYIRETDEYLRERWKYIIAIDKKGELGFKIKKQRNGKLEKIKE